MFVSHAKVRIVGLGGRSRKRRPHRRRLELREMAKMPCLVPTALTVLLGLLAVAFGAGMALLGYLPTMDAVVEVSKNGTGAGRTGRLHAPSTSRSTTVLTPSSVHVGASDNGKNTHGSIVFNSSVPLSPTATSTRIFSVSSGTGSGSSSLLTNGPSYHQPSESAPPTNLPHDQQQQTSLQEQQHSHHPNLDGITTISATTTTATSHGSGAAVKRQMNTHQFLALQACSYAGPVVMAVGMFAMIMACVFYCEILDKYAILVPDKGHDSGLQKDELYQVIIEEMKKSYAQTLITAYTKAAERSLLIHEHNPGVPVGAPAAAAGAVRPDSEDPQQRPLPDPLLPYNPLEPLSLEQQIDIECEGYTPSPPIPNKRYSVIQARIQRLRSEDNWLKTSSLPNIRRSMSIKRAGRVGTKIADNSRTLSYDYTMDEARLRRKSMMLRSIVHWNSGSSGDLLAQQAQAARAMHQRRFSSAKALQSQPDDSLDELLQEQSHGSFPLTRLIQRRGTFACGDMRTRRMKFLILLQASESNEVFQQQKQQHHRRQSTFPSSKHPQHDNISMDSRSALRFAGIRRNSFIPYNTCDKFITTEEKRTARSSRRSSVNPFAPRLAQQYSQPERGTIRRHSFFPIRREDKIYESDPLEQRRHSFNPIGVNNTLKTEYAGGAGTHERRGSYNPDSKRGSYAPLSTSSGQQKSSRFLQVPGFEHEFHMERGPGGDSSDSETAGSPHLPSSPSSRQSDVWPYSCSHRPPGKLPLHGMGSPLPEAQPERQVVERRHSFNPVVRISAAGPDNETTTPGSGVPNVPIIVLNADTSGRFLTVPSQDIELGMTSGGFRGAEYVETMPEQRRHSFNAPFQPTESAQAYTKAGIEKPVPQRNISFKLDSLSTSMTPQVSSSLPTPPSNQFAKRSSLKRASIHKPTQVPSPTDSTSGAPVRPSSFKQEMVLFQPLARPDSRGTSPSSNLSFCGSERIGSERSPKASRTASMSSDNSAFTTSTLLNESCRNSEAPHLSPGAFRPVSPAGQLAYHHFHPASPRCRDRDVFRYAPTTADSISQYNELQFLLHSGPNPAGEIRRSASFRESRRRRVHHVRTDSSGSTGSGPATLSPSLNTDANAAIHRSRSAGSLPGERNIARREGDFRALRGSAPRWDDIRMSPQEAKRLAEESFASRTSSPQSPLRAFSYASSRVPKPPSPLVGKHWPPSRHDADSNSS